MSIAPGSSRPRPWWCKLGADFATVSFRTWGVLDQGCSYSILAGREKCRHLGGVNRINHGSNSCTRRITVVEMGKQTFAPRSVKEIDALDGVMAMAADESCIQYKMLNISFKGPAV